MIAKQLLKKSLDAARRVEISQWDFGDAILEACGAPSVRAGDVSIKEMMTYLKENGLEYEHGTINRYRTVSYRFPPPRRKSYLSWTVHQESGDPDTLDKVCAELGEKHVPRAKMRAALQQFAQVRTRAWEEFIAQPKVSFDGKSYADLAKDQQERAKTAFRETFISSTPLDTLLIAHELQLEADTALAAASKATRILTMNNTISDEAIAAFAETALKAAQKWAQLASDTRCQITKPELKPLYLKVV